MRTERTATIIVTIAPVDVKETKIFTGTEEEIYTEAHDFMNEVVMRFIEGRNITTLEDQYMIADYASHTIVWDECDVAIVIMFAVYEDAHVEDPVLGIYATLADAEEAIFTECEWYAYEVMMTGDPLDVYGMPSWDWKIDYKWLMEDALRTFSIQEVPAYM